MAGATTLGTAYIKIQPTAEGIKGSISNVLGGEAESAGSSVGGKIGTFAKKALAAAAIGTALVSGIKAALDEGAKLQQSYLGGLDTLYGEAAEGMRAYAREAAKAGISMNDYAEQAVSFGAALKAAYGGDTMKAMDAANMAILDMTDNAAKMGTPIESIQQAYQGFAKGQYQLLDNLKLGYGGTKTEMERLLADAQKITGIKYDINNLGDVYQAIHVIQGELGLTGVAAQEASETFAGSFAAMKAAARNVLGSLALGEGVGPALTDLLDTVDTFIFKNLIPMLGTIVRGLPDVIATFIREGFPRLLSHFNNFLVEAKTFLQNLTTKLTSENIKNWATETIPKLISTAGDLLGKFAKSLIDNLPQIIAAIGQIGLNIVKGLGEAIWPKIVEAANGIKDKFLAPINALRDKISEIVGKIKSFFSFTISAPHIPLPHFYISPSGWRLSDLLKGSIPSLGISWYAKGGITDGTNLIGVGEAGPEAILPLDTFWKKMDKIAENSGGDININVYATPGMDVNALAEAVQSKLIQAENRRRMAWG